MKKEIKKKAKDGKVWRVKERKRESNKDERKERNEKRKGEKCVNAIKNKENAWKLKKMEEWK